MTETTVAAESTSEEQEDTSTRTEPHGTKEAEEEKVKPTTEEELARWKSSSRKHEDAKKDALKRAADLEKQLEEAQEALGKYEKAEREAAEAARKAKVDALGDADRTLFDKMVARGLAEDDALAVISDSVDSGDTESKKEKASPFTKVRPNSFDKKPKAADKKQQTREERLAAIRNSLGR